VLRLLRGRTNRPPGEHSHTRLGVAPANGKVRRTNTTPRLVREEALYEAILEGVIRNDNQASAGIQYIECRRQRRPKRSKLVVDLDPERLERAAGGVAAVAPGGRRNRFLDNLGELGCRWNRPGTNDCASHATGEPLLSVGADHAREIALGVLVHNHVRGELSRPVHSHVEGSLAPEAEPPIRLIKLG
jgi:hypothetical protein